MLLIPLFFFVTLYPMFLKVGLKDIYPYDEFWGFATEFTVYFFFCFRFHRKIERHRSKCKVKELDSRQIQAPENFPWLDRYASRIYSVIFFPKVATAAFLGSMGAPYP
jgi:hypothetical protein